MSDEMPAPRRVGRALQPWQEVGVGREARTTTPSLVCGVDSQREVTQPGVWDRLSLVMG